MYKMPDLHHPVAPFSPEPAVQKARATDDGWLIQDLLRVLLAYTTDSYWRSRSEFVSGRQGIVALLVREWTKELGFRLIKTLWVYSGARITLCSAYEWRHDAGRRIRSGKNDN
jgi:uncharacterized protein